MTDQTAQPATPVDSQPAPAPEAPAAVVAPAAPAEAPVAVVAEPPAVVAEVAPAPSEPEEITGIVTEYDEEGSTPPIALRPCPAGPDAPVYQADISGRA